MTRVALISSSLSLPGKSIAGDRETWKAEHPDSKMEDGGARVEQHGDEYFVIPETLDQLWMADLPSDDPFRKSLRPSPLSGPMTPAPEATPKEWKISFLVTTELDDAMPELFQMWLVERAKEAGAEVDVLKIRSGHFVQNSHVDEVGGWLKEMTG